MCEANSLLSRAEVNDDEAVPPFPVRLHGMVLNEAQGQLSLCLY
jgi:hypothetical protein